MSSSSPYFHLGFTNAELGVPTVDEAYARIMRDLDMSGQSMKLQAYHDQYLAQLEALTVGGPVRLTVVGDYNYEWKK